jgi:hypothetical protein
MQSRRYIIWTLCISCILASLILARGDSSAAQTTPTAIPAAIQLTVGRTVTGSLSKQGQSRDYIFTIPDDKDLIVWFQADKTILASDCQIQISRSSQPPSNVVCGGGGGASDDFPVAQAYIYPAQTDPKLHSVVAINLSRIFNGIGNYKLMSYLMPAKPIEQGTPISDNLTAAEPFQDYALKHDPTSSFFIEAEENQSDPGFLWVAHIYTGPDSVSDSALVRQEDSASRTVAKTGLLNAYLVYVGNNQYRVLVHDIGGYTVKTFDVQAHTLDNSPSVKFSDSVSYQKPISIALFDVNAGETLTVTGSSPQGSVYSEVRQGSRQLASFQIEPPFPDELPSSASVTVPMSGQVYLDVQLSDSAPQTQFSFNLTVTRQQATETPK